VIADAILDWLFAGVEYLAGLLPTSSLDLSDLAALGAYTGWLGSIFDMSAIVGAVTVALAVEVSWVSIKLALFIWRLTPFSG